MSLKAPLPLQPHHPLERTWAITCLIAGSGWKVQNILSFTTVEDFWSLFNRLKLVSELDSNYSYHVFQEGIQPTWEDKNNTDGGCWTFEVGDLAKGRVLNDLWLNTILSLIGEQYDEDGKSICGVVINLRKKGNRIQLWTRRARDKNVCIRIGTVWKSLLGVSSPFKLIYKSHAAELQKEKSQTSLSSAECTYTL